mgnify:CR=1 FL=1
MRKMAITAMTAVLLLSGAGLSAAIKVYMLPQADNNGEEVHVGDICKIEGTGCNDLPILVLPPSLYSDRIIDRSELADFLSRYYSGNISVFGNGTTVQVLKAAESDKELTPVFSVKRGDRVTVLFEKGPITISMSGNSLGSGGIEDEIDVRLKNGKKVRCVITGDKRVRVLI